MQARKEAGKSNTPQLIHERTLYCMVVVRLAPHEKHTDTLLLDAGMAAAVLRIAEDESTLSLPPKVRMAAFILQATCLCRRNPFSSACSPFPSLFAELVIRGTTHISDEDAARLVAAPCNTMQCHLLACRIALHECSSCFRRMLEC